MKKTFKFMSLMLAMLASLTTFVACGDDDEDDNNGNQPGTTTGITTNDLVGTWNMPGVQMAYTFTNDQLTVNQWGEEIYKGPYALKDGVLTYSEVSLKLVLLADKSVLVTKRTVENGDLIYEELDFIGIKQGKTVNLTAKDIEGTWFAPEQGRSDFQLGGVTVKGNTFDLIITMWGQRYTGTFTYVNGTMNLKYEKGYTSREPGTGYGTGPGNMNPQTLEATWSNFEEEYWTIPNEDMFFVASGNEAYGFIAGRPCIFKKQ
jgi:hypothetical protein